TLGVITLNSEHLWSPSWLSSVFQTEPGDFNSQCAIKKEFLNFTSRLPYKCILGNLTPRRDFQTE
ncbi:hypothetical protein STEG23_024151, partial [Scotinomys teguina]